MKSEVSRLIDQKRVKLKAQNKAATADGGQSTHSVQQSSRAQTESKDIVQERSARTSQQPPRPAVTVEAPYRNTRSRSRSLPPEALAEAPVVTGVRGGRGRRGQRRRPVSTGQPALPPTQEDEEVRTHNF